MLASIRIGQSHRALAGLSHLVKLLRSVKSNNTPEAQSRLCQEISLQSSKVAVDLTCERHFMQMTAESVQFDPRFLVFEFTYSMMLRKSQVILVNKFIAALKSNRSMCHQMIMGAGKTTVVAPLLAMILADGKSLVTQVVPHALLDFSRGVMREKFAAGSYDHMSQNHNTFHFFLSTIFAFSVVRKPVFTFSFSRATPITRDLYLKLCKARDSKAIICATPTSIKSFMLKFVEMMRHLEKSKTGRDTAAPENEMFLSRIARRFREQSVVTELNVNPEDVYYCTEILKLFKEGVLLLDEVDLILHPLKSELNWPIGDKNPIDYTRSKKFGIGIRWDMQWHLLVSTRSSLILIVIVNIILLTTFGQCDRILSSTHRRRRCLLTSMTVGRLCPFWRASLLLFNVVWQKISCSTTLTLLYWTKISMVPNLSHYLYVGSCYTSALSGYPILKTNTYCHT